MFRYKMKGKRFCLGLTTIEGTITPNYGMVFFCSDDRKVIAPIELFVPEDKYGARCSVYTHHPLGDMVYTPDTDDKLVETLTSKDIDLLSQFDEVESWLEEEKMKSLPWVLRIGSAMILSIIALLFALFFKSLLAIVACGCLIAICCLSLFLLQKRLSTTKIWDDYGHCIDLITGETNLNDSFIIPIEAL